MKLALIAAALAVPALAVAQTAPAPDNFQPITMSAPDVRQMHDYLVNLRGPTWTEIGPVIQYLERAETTAQGAARAKAAKDAQDAADATSKAKVAAKP